MKDRNDRKSGTENIGRNDRRIEESLMRNSRKEEGMARRKFLGFLGVGLAGALAVKAIPGRFVSTKLSGMRKKSKEIKAIPNELAVKRSKKA